MMLLVFYHHDKIKSFIILVCFQGESMSQVIFFLFLHVHANIELWTLFIKK